VMPASRLAGPLAPPPRRFGFCPAQPILPPAEIWSEPVTETLPPLLTPSERVTLKAIRDTGSASELGLAAALRKRWAAKRGVARGKAPPARKPATASRRPAARALEDDEAARLAARGARRKAVASTALTSLNGIHPARLRYRGPLNAVRLPRIPPFLFKEPCHDDRDA
jgi:hypothetical protein